MSPGDAVDRVAKVLDELLAQVANRSGVDGGSQEPVQVGVALTDDSGQKLRTLATMLALHDMDALDLAASLKAELFSLMGQKAAASFLQSIDELDFNLANDALSESLTTYAAK